MFQILDSRVGVLTSTIGFDYVAVTAISFIYTSIASFTTVISVPVGVMPVASLKCLKTA